VEKNKMQIRKTITDILWKKNPDVRATPENLAIIREKRRLENVIFSEIQQNWQDTLQRRKASREIWKAVESQNEHWLLEADKILGTTDY
jgi:hypothetical protein